MSGKREEGRRSMEVETSDKVDMEAQDLLERFYGAEDTQEIAETAKRLLAVMEPFLRRMAAIYQPELRKLGLEYGDYCQELRLALWKALHRSRQGVPIDNIYPYAFTISRNIFLEHARRLANRLAEGSDGLENAVASDDIDAFLAREHARALCDTVWDFLLQRSVRVRWVMLLNLSKMEILEACRLPDPFPWLAKMLEIEEDEVSELWKQIPLSSNAIAAKLGTSPDNVNRIRSQTRDLLRQVVFPPGQNNKK